ncbi:MAG: hypothetical protein COZ70_01320 [Deltaproteobacteria bacterium CG_4_8_14_3_um_filter_51_11]|nr:MAG: hypothetical protein COZ70_01320 [Deltaproteobacteria bacterium CG_4_8_14_3_um_filter_51_11]PIY25963.1 MAG: hypothetical protein COZ11_03975 [Deltaproteobacteria bacterium CG_4_10_14_3_um_filter_51_14]
MTSVLGWDLSKILIGNILALKQGANPQGQGQPAWAVHAYQHDAMVRTRNEEVDVREIQILRDQKTALLLCTAPDIPVRTTCHSFLNEGLYVVAHV